MATGYGLIGWGTGVFGLPFSPLPPSNPYINIINPTPTPGSYNIARNTTFTFTVKSKFAPNPNTTYVMLDNKLVINGGSYNTTDFTIIVSTNVDGISKDYSITPNYLFIAGQVLTLQVSATDVYGNPAPAFWAGYIVVDDRPPLLTPIYPLDGYTNVPIDLSIHFLINQFAAPSSGLDVSTLNIRVDGNLAVVDGIIQTAYDAEYSLINVPNNIVDPIEIVLDYAGRYSAGDIIGVDVSIKEIGIVPVPTTSGTITNQNGVVVAENVVVTTITKLAAAEYNLVLDDALSTYILTGNSVYNGYTFIDDAGNKFKIAIVGVQQLIVTTTAKLRTSQFSFVTGENERQLVTPVFAGYFQGIYFVDNLGDGYHINTSWQSARTTRPDYDLAYLIYYSTTRSDVFYEEPKLITQGRKLERPETIHGVDAQLNGYFAQIPLPVGVTYYFGVRATEYPHSTMPFIPADGYGANAAGRVVVDGYSFGVPQAQTLSSSVVGSGAIAIVVATTAGYANVGGYITVGSEIMRYTSITPTSFIVASTGRGLMGTEIVNTHNTGELVRLYYGNYDDNSVIEKGVVGWERPYDPKRMRPDLITTDMTLEDGYNSTFEPFDYCGYHRQDPVDLFTSNQCGTYLGGTYNGTVGMMLTERQQAVEEQLLSVTGEPVILLRRIWQGETCNCRTSRRDSALVRSCPLCFGTGYKGGYIQYFNPREINQRIMVHFAPTDEDVGMGAQAAWQQTFKPNAWTLNVPSIKDRDLIVRFDHYNTNKIQWIYVVNNVSRGVSILGEATRQRMNISRIDKTDVAYQYKLVK